MESIFKKNDVTALQEFIEMWAALEEIDKDKAFKLAMTAKKYYGAGKKARAEQRPNQELEKHWYASLKAGTPDYSVYADQYLLSDIWACWSVYSRKYLLSMQKEIVCDPPENRSEIALIDRSRVKSVIDLGCGFGYTTAALKELFPKAEVYGTQFKDCCQWKLAEAIGKERGFSLVTGVSKINKQIDLVFASEYFEHIEKPIEHLLEILTICKPKYILTASAFGTTSLGHFHEYIYAEGCRKRSGKEISRIFNQVLRSAGYTQQSTGCWNNRPAYWKKTSTENSFDFLDYYKKPKKKGAH